MLASFMAMAEPAPKAVDLSKLYKHFEKAGHSSLELTETTEQVLISGAVLDVSQSFSGNSILKVRAHANSQELARLTAADDAQQNKLAALQAGDKFTAICDLAFSSGAPYVFSRVFFQIKLPDITLNQGAYSTPVNSKVLQHCERQLRYITLT
ncbi:hypothetical protein ACFOHT_05975 [Massilia oculi]|uniref:hypothetical protein n=1 Tax=Massilia oculi TaxID=945844 RepID=UPI0013B3EDAF|nr:hypothetical protein [Massilia oculi]